MFVSLETLKAANSGIERETEKDTNTKLKNASRNEKPAWLISLENTVGCNDNSIGSNNADDEELKQASSNNSNNTSMPNWLITYRNTVGWSNTT